MADFSHNIPTTIAAVVMSCQVGPYYILQGSQLGKNGNYFFIPLAYIAPSTTMIAN